MAKKKKQEEVVKTTDNILLENYEVKTIKNDLEKYIDERVNKVFIDELDKSNRRLIREKNRKIFVKNIVILILFLIIGFLLYLLYTNKYFDKYLSKDSNISEKEEKKENKNEENKDSDIKKETKLKEPTLEELKDKYASLLNNYSINEKCLYLKDFYDADLTRDLKNYLVFNSIDFTTLEKEEDYEIITDINFEKAYKKLFYDDYVSGSFDYNGNKIRYVNLMKSYMITNSLIKEDSNIRREIVDIKVSNNDISITTIEGIVKDNKLYNVVTNDYINEYKNDSLLKYKELLNQVVYNFKDNALISLEK